MLDFITGKSLFKKLHFSFLKSSVVWFKKDLCTESKKCLTLQFQINKQVAYSFFQKSTYTFLHIINKGLFKFWPPTTYLPTYLPIVDFHEHLVHYQPFVHMNLLKTPPYLLAYVNFIMYTSTNVNLVLTV